MKNISIISLNLTFREDTPTYITGFFTKGIKHEMVPTCLYDYGFTFDNKPNFSGKTTMICEEKEGRFYLYIYHKFDFDTEAGEGYWFTGGLAQYAEDDDMAGYIKHSDETVGVQIVAFKDKVPYWKSDLKVEIDLDIYDKIEPIIRELRVDDYPFLEDFLYEAIYVHEGDAIPDKTIIFYPELYSYIKDFGREHDLGFIIKANHKPVGAIWTRLFSAEQSGYGFVDIETPELSMAINTDFRNQGFGRQLLEKMFFKLQDSGYKQVSLSVDKRNFAYQLYQKMGFQEHQIEGNTVVMVKDLSYLPQKNQIEQKI
jgi:ribosomal protein S18 acetylase RimI-like enzyme